MTRRNTCSPDGIRTRATALRGRRARPLHNGALAGVSPTCARALSAVKPYRHQPYFSESSRFPEEADDQSWGTRTRT